MLALVSVKQHPIIFDKDTKEQVHSSSLLSKFSNVVSRKSLKLNAEKRIGLESGTRGARFETRVPFPYVYNELCRILTTQVRRLTF